MLPSHMKKSAWEIQIGFEEVARVLGPACVECLGMARGRFSGAFFIRVHMVSAVRLALKQSGTSWKLEHRNWLRRYVVNEYFGNCDSGFLEETLLAPLTHLGNNYKLC